jgi:hypothetical protein
MLALFFQPPEAQAGNSPPAASLVLIFFNSPLVGLEPTLAQSREALGHGSILPLSPLHYTNVPIGALLNISF